MGIYFEFKDGQECFYAGKPVEGTVIFKANYDISSVDELLIYLEGKGKVHWSEGSNSSRRHYSNKEKYFRLETCLLQDIPDNKLKKGTYSFPFSFMLPKDTPQTIHHNDFATAYITYMLKARIVRSGIYVNIKHKEEIHVVGDSPLSNCPQDPTEPAVSRGVRIVCCWWFYKDGPIDFELVTNKTGYACGETITVNFNIENLSYRNVTSTRLVFYRQLRLVTDRKTRVFEDQKFETIKTGSCRPRLGVAIKDQQFEIPSHFAPSLTSSEMIIPEYIIELRGKISGCNRSFKLGHEILVASMSSENPPEDAAAGSVAPSLPFEEVPAPSYGIATGLDSCAVDAATSLLDATGDATAPAVKC